MRKNSFYEVLEEQIRADLRKEIATEIAAEIATEFEGATEAAVLARLGIQAAEAGPLASIRSKSQKAQHQHRAESVETWLASRVGKWTFDRRHHGANAYKSHLKTDTTQSPAEEKKTAQPPNSPSQGGAYKDAPPQDSRLRIEASNFSELCAIELLQRFGKGKLPEAFCMDEVKTLWRKAALKTHPDRFPEASAQQQADLHAVFAEISQAYEILLEAFAKKEQEAMNAKHQGPDRANRAA